LPFNVVLEIKNMDIYVAGGLSLFTAVIVAVLSHIFSIRRNRKDELSAMRIKAYSDFINSASKLASARRVGKTDDALDELGALNDAKTRICVFGSKAVALELMKFWKAGGTLEEEQSILAFTGLCLEMRKSLGTEIKELRLSDMSDTLFKLEPSSFSFREKNKKI